MKSSKFLCLVIMLSLMACKGDDDSTTTGPPPPPPKPVDVYVGGYEYNASGNAVAKIWKNGEVFQRLTDGGSDDRVRLNSIFVTEGLDIYAVGYFSNDDWNYNAIWWKNGVQNYLSTYPVSLRERYANEIYIDDTDIYVVGSAGEYHGGIGLDTSIAILWKNGSPTLLTDGKRAAIAEGVFASNGDVYVAGHEKNDSGKRVAKYWKNGVPTILSSGGTEARANSVYVDGSDVYVAGYEADASGLGRAKLWKNGVATSLGDASVWSYTYDVEVVNGDVYVAGNEGRIATVWKNGAPTKLNDGFFEATVRSVAIHNGDVYAAGYEYVNGSGEPIARLWKNGALSNLTLEDSNKTSLALSIFLR